MPTDGGVDEQNAVYLHSGILFGHKKEEILIGAITWMRLEDMIAK